MRPRERRETGQTDLFKARPDQIVDMNHALAKTRVFSRRASEPSTMTGLGSRRC